MDLEQPLEGLLGSDPPTIAPGIVIFHLSVVFSTCFFIHHRFAPTPLSFVHRIIGAGLPLVGGGLRREGMQKRLVDVGSLGWFGAVLREDMFRRVWSSSLRPSEAVTPPPCCTR